MHRLFSIGSLTVALATTSCTGDLVGPLECTTEARAGLTVTVLDAAGARVCDAAVTAEDGDYSESLMMLGDPSSCTYSGAYERAGTYSVRAVRGSSDKTASAVVVSHGDCHVNGQLVTITFD